MTPLDIPKTLTINLLRCCTYGTRVVTVEDDGTNNHYGKRQQVTIPFGTSPRTLPATLERYASIGAIPEEWITLLPKAWEVVTPTTALGMAWMCVERDRALRALALAKEITELRKEKWEYPNFAYVKIGTMPEDLQREKPQDFDTLTELHGMCEDHTGLLGTRGLSEPIRMRLRALKRMHCGYGVERNCRPILRLPLQQGFTRSLLDGEEVCMVVLR